MHQLSAVLSPPGGEAALRVQGTWGGHEPDPATGLGVRCPDVPPPDDPVLRPPRHSPEFGHLPINGQFDERHCPGSAAPGALVAPEMDASSMVWTRLGGDHHDERQPFDPALFALYADRVPGPHLGATITDHPSIEVPPGALVTLEATLRIIGVPSTDWVLLEGVIPEAAGRYVTIRANMWDEAGRLVAIADQTARFAATEVKQPDR
jgi:hypothetical protein